MKTLYKIIINLSTHGRLFELLKSETAALAVPAEKMMLTETDQSFSAERYYFSQLEKGLFTIPRCQVCARMHFYPRMVCPHCGSDALTWVSPSGKGEVYATTIVRHKDGDYTVCLIDLEEGPRLMSRVVGGLPDAVHIGMRVAACVDRVDGKPLLVFTPIEKEQA